MLHYSRNNRKVSIVVSYITYVPVAGAQKCVYIHTRCVFIINIYMIYMCICILEWLGLEAHLVPTLQCIYVVLFPPLD